MLTAAGGLAADSGLQQAWQFYVDDYFDEARGIFQAAAQRPGPAQAEALFGWAMCCQNDRSNRQSAKAMELYQRIIREFPQGELAPRSLLNLGRLQELNFEAPDPARAIETYQQLEARYPRSPEAELALMRRAFLLMASWQPARFNAGLAAGREFLERYPQSRWTLTMHLRLGDTLLLKARDARRGIEHLIAAGGPDGRGYVDGQTAAASLYRVAYTAHYELKDAGLAATYYKLLIERYPRDPRIYAAKKRLETLTK